MPGQGRAVVLRAAAGCLALAAAAATGPSAAVPARSAAAPAAALAPDAGVRAAGAARPALLAVAAAPRPASGPAPGPARLKHAVNLAAAQREALDRANAKVTAVTRALAALETRAETLSERYDQAMWLEQQDSAASAVAAARFAAARRTQRATARQLGEQAAADLKAGGGQGRLALMFGGPGGPGAYLNAVGMAEVVANNRVDLVAQSQADTAVTSLFARQAAGLLARARSDMNAAGSLKKAVEAAVAVQLTAVRAASARRGQAAGRFASATRAAAALKAASETPAPDRIPGSANYTPGQGWAPGDVATPAQGAAAVDWAVSQIGKPYRWGGAGPGSYDCSGLAMDAWTRTGVTLAHWTGYQWLSGPHVALTQLRPGDLVFYATNTADPATIHHVGIYLRQGMMVDAPYTGADVRIDSIHQFAGLIGATRPAA